MTHLFWEKGGACLWGGWFSMVSLLRYHTQFPKGGWGRVGREVYLKTFPRSPFPPVSPLFIPPRDFSKTGGAPLPFPPPPIPYTYKYTTHTHSRGISSNNLLSGNPNPNAIPLIPPPGLDTLHPNGADQRYIDPRSLSRL